MIFSMNKSSLLPVNTITLFSVLLILMTIILFIIVSIKFKNNRKKVIGIWCITWLMITIILFTTGSFGKVVSVKAANTKTFTKEELYQDLEQLEKIVKNETTLYFTNKEKLLNSFSITKEKIEDNMTELEFYRLINPIVTEIKCGHTNLSISEALEKNRKSTAKFFPLKVTLVDNELYILENDNANHISSGDKIHSINGKTSDEIIDILVKNISIDSHIKEKAYYIISKHFNSRYYDFVDSSDEFNVELIDKKGKLKEVQLKGKYKDEFNTSAWNLHFSDFKDGNYYNSKITEDYSILDINVFFKEKDNKFKDFLDDFFLDINENNVDKLIIDLRGNFGGNPDMSIEILSHLIKDKIEYFDSDLPFAYNLMGLNKPISPSKIHYDGDVIVLIDGAVFSTSGHLASLIKYHNIGTLIGSETGGTYVCNASAKDTVLNNTRLRLHYSTLTYKVAVKGMSVSNGVRPDIKVSPSIDDILSNKDITLESGLNVLLLKNK